jgi:hypothetical protein
MPRKQKSRKLSSDKQVPVEEQRSLVDLPELVLSAIAKHGFGISETRLWWSRRHKGHPMLAVSRSLRDTVLASLTKIRLDLQPELDSCCQPEGRLLHRACCQAAPGIHLELAVGNNQHALPQLLQPALDVGGWHNVHHLEVSCMATCATELLATCIMNPWLTALPYDALLYHCRLRCREQSF